MLYKSGENLFNGAEEFLSNSSEITLFSAYIRTEQLALLNKNNRIKRIIVRWEIKDLHQGASDLDLYQYCLDNKIALFRNTRIHLKCILNDKDEVFLGSANVTGRGLGEKGSRFNFELNASVSNIDALDVLYLDKILSQSEYVSEDLFNKIKMKVESLEEFIDNTDYKDQNFETSKNEADYFLISELPMFLDIDSLFEKSQNLSSLNSLDRKCVTHDLATYNLDVNLNQQEFYDHLKSIFNNHPFILKLKEQVISDRRQSMGYGQVVRWITENTTTVPTPISWELKEKQVVNILYEWICFFDPNFTWSTPGHSQVLFYKNVSN